MDITILHVCQIHNLLVVITCPNETSSSIYWPTTIAGRTSAQPCLTTVPDSFKVTRECDLFGEWISPDISDCKNDILNMLMKMLLCSSHKVKLRVMNANFLHIF